MIHEVKIGSITAEVELKGVKNIHLSVYPPHGKVKIAAPESMNIESIRVYALSKLAWIKKQQKKLQNQPRESSRIYRTRESHWVWGTRYLLDVKEVDMKPSLVLSGKKMQLTVRPATDSIKRTEIVNEWYRGIMKQKLDELIREWSNRLNVTPKKVIVQQMKTRWGACSESGLIRLNLELARKPIECLLYVLVHELAHLIEPTHNSRFTDILDLYYPKWKSVRSVLQSLPLKQEEWNE